jgi:hypothetical protein
VDTKLITLDDESLPIPANSPKMIPNETAMAVILSVWYDPKKYQLR